MVSPSEHIEQVRFVAWFRKTYPEIKIFAIPNGGHRSKSTAASLKAEGVTPGIPDLCAPAWKLWVEMKREKGGKLSPAQKEWKEYLESVGYHWIQGNGFEDAKRKVNIFVDTMINT